MATAIYRLTRLEASHRGGINAAIDAQIRGIAKTNQQYRYTIANEMVAAALGQALGLPVPTGVVAESGGTLYYLSLDVSREGHALPPIIASDFVRDEPRLAAGCVVFDIWIANSDRHNGNLSRDPGFNVPRVSLFDHGHALLGASDPEGADRLATLESSLGCAGVTAPGNRHVLIDLLDDDSALMSWVDRVEQIPDYLIEEACTALVPLGVGLNGDTAQTLAGWLLDRRRRLRHLIFSHRDEFPSIQQWGLEGSAP